MPQRRDAEMEAEFDAGVRPRPTKEAISPADPSRIMDMIELYRGDGSRGTLHKIARRPELDPTLALSVTCWVRTEYGAYHYLVSRGEWTEGYSLGVLAPHDGAGGVLRGFIGGAKLIGTTKINECEFYHVGMTFDGQSARLYVNGKCEAAVPIKRPEGIVCNATDLFVGGEALGLGDLYRGESQRHFLNGEIRSLEILSRAKDDTEMEAEFDAGVRPRPTKEER